MYIHKWTSLYSSLPSGFVINITLALNPTVSTTEIATPAFWFLFVWCTHIHTHTGNSFIQIKFTTIIYLKCTIQSFLVYSELYNHNHHQFQNIFITLKEISYPLVIIHQTSHIPPNIPVLGNH